MDPELDAAIQDISSLLLSAAIIDTAEGSTPRLLRAAGMDRGFRLTNLRWNPTSPIPQMEPYRFGDKLRSVKTYNELPVSRSMAIALANSLEVVTAELYHNAFNINASNKRGIQLFGTETFRDAMNRLTEAYGDSPTESDSILEFTGYHLLMQGIGTAASASTEVLFCGKYATQEEQEKALMRSAACSGEVMVNNGYRGGAIIQSIKAGDFGSHPNKKQLAQLGYKQGRGCPVLRSRMSSQAKEQMSTSGNNGVLGVLHLAREALKEQLPEIESRPDAYEPEIHAAILSLE